jgi:hypothetical protein
MATANPQAIQAGGPVSPSFQNPRPGLPAPAPVSPGVRAQPFPLPGGLPSPGSSKSGQVLSILNSLGQVPPRPTLPLASLPQVPRPIGQPNFQIPQLPQPTSVQGQTRLPQLGPNPGQANFSPFRFGGL